MIDGERLKREWIRAERAQRDTIKALQSALKAKDETIAALKAVVELYRTGAVSGNAPVSPYAEIAPFGEHIPSIDTSVSDAYLDQRFEAASQRMWLDDDEEEMQALLASGALSEEQKLEAQAALQTSQARRAPINLAQ